MCFISVGIPVDLNFKHGRLELVITHIGRLSLSLSLSLFKERTCSYGSCTWIHGSQKIKNWEVITKSKNPPTLVIYIYTNDKQPCRQMVCVYSDHYSLIKCNLCLIECFFYVAVCIIISLTTFHLFCESLTQCNDYIHIRRPSPFISNPLSFGIMASQRVHQILSSLS